MRKLLGLLLVVVACPTAGLARDIYVDNVNGDDRTGGQSPGIQGEEGGPCRSISKALRIAQAGDRIVVANTGVPYRECLTLQGPQHSGSDNFPTHINGNGATLDGTMSLADAKWEYFRGETFRTRPARMSHQQLFIDDQPATRKQPAAGQTPELGPLEWCLVDGWLYFNCGKDRLPQSHNLACCLHSAGVTLYNVHDVIVENLNIRGFFLDGVNCHDNVVRSDLLGLTSSYNGRSGISVGGASRVRIDSCTAAGNGVAQIRTEGYCVVMLVDNKLDATSAPAVVKEGGKVVEDN
jgi:hypothetical protein